MIYPLFRVMSRGSQSGDDSDLVRWMETLLHCAAKDDSCIISFLSVVNVEATVQPATDWKLLWAAWVGWGRGPPAETRAFTARVTTERRAACEAGLGPYLQGWHEAYTSPHSAPPHPTPFHPASHAPEGSRAEGIAPWKGPGEESRPRHATPRLCALKAEDATAIRDLTPNPFRHAITLMAIFRGVAPRWSAPECPRVPPSAPECPRLPST